MKLQHRREDFVLKEVLNRMLRILRLISQDLEKIRDRKSLHIKHAYGFDEVVRDDVCYEDNEENGNFVSLNNIIPSEENTNWPFVSTTNPQYKDIDLDQLPKFDAYLDIVGREEVMVHPSFDLVEEREIVVNTISCCSLDLPKEDKKSCDIFQQLLDYEKKLFFLNYVEVRHEQYEKTLLEKLLIKEFILRYWSDWMDVITKVGKFKVRRLCRSSVLKINPYAYEDVLEDYNIQNSRTNFLQPGGK
ncbi:hypothetical protein WN943_007261 [Citrus x changshan-huyou]